MSISSPVKDSHNSGSAIEVEERFLGGAKSAARFLGVSEGFIFKYIHEIPHYKVGGPKSGKLLFKPSELIAWVEHRREPVKASV